jgi:hypothetical protein
MRATQNGAHHWGTERRELPPKLAQVKERYNPNFNADDELGVHAAPMSAKLPL